MEVMPNTIDDKNLEYFTIKNTSYGVKSLSGFILSDRSEKIYTFLDEILHPWEQKSFYRPDTKIILNNSDETVFLHDSENNLVDEIFYEKSEKWYFLSFPEEEGESFDEDIISQEWLISWELFISDETDIQTLNISWSEEIFLQRDSPEIIFWLQRPSYILESDIFDTFLCDSEKDECKVNFNLQGSFSSELPERDYVCKIDFWTWIITGEEQKCNPNTVIFFKWEFEVVFKISHEDDPNIFSEKKILIKNLPHDLADEIHSNENDQNQEVTWEGQDLKDSIYIWPLKILVQSGLEWNWKYFYCKKSICKINLNYVKKQSDEKCRWDFWDGSFKSKKTRNLCNPWYVTFHEWIHELSLLVYEKDNISNSRTLLFYIYNHLWEDILQEQNKIISEIIPDVSEDKIINNQEEDFIVIEKLDAEISIIVQWKISKEKILGLDSLTCQWVVRCYINLTSSWAIKNQSFSWLLDGIEFSDTQNPKGIWIEWQGEHTIEMVYSDTQNNTFRKSFLVYIQEISKISPIIVSEDQWEEWNKQDISKIFTQNFLALKYDWLRISWKAPIWSRIEIFIEWKKVWEGIIDEKWKYRVVTKNILPWEYNFSTKLILDDGEEIFLENYRTYTLEAESRNFWFMTKKSSPKKKSNIIKTLTTPELIIQSYAPDASINQIEYLSRSKNILFIFCIVLTLVFAWLHTILIQIKYLRKSHNLELFTLSINIRQRVLLTL